MSVGGLELGIGKFAKADFVRNRCPIQTMQLEGDLAHHGVARFIPELAGHVVVKLPVLAVPVVDDQCHQFRDVHFGQPHVELKPVALGSGDVGAGGEAPA